MDERRKKKDRRVNPDRRKGDDSSYSGPERRKLKHRRLDISRRETKDEG